MEDGQLGHHCEFEFCNQKDFLPYFCSDCNKYYCADHRHVSCAKVLQNPIVPEFKVQEERRDCQFFQIERCKSKAFVTCPLCQNIFCIQHRMEDQHQCLAIKQKLEEEKQADLVKQNLLQKISNRVEQQQPTVLDEKKQQTMRKIQQMKTKSVAKGDATIPRDQRFALLVSIEGKEFPLFFKQTQVVGQVIDQICLQTGIQLVTNYQNLNESQLYCYYESTHIQSNTKLTDICKIVPDFQQGDKVVIRRGLLIN